MKYKNLLLLLTACAVLLSLSACFETTESSKVDLQSARAAAISGISARVGNALDDLNTAVFDAESVALLERAGVPALSASGTGSSTMVASKGRAKVTLKPGLAKRLAKGAQRVAGRETGGSYEDGFGAILDPLLANGTVDGDTITYRPDASMFCEYNDTQCIDFWNNVTIVQTVASTTEGVLSFRYTDTANSQVYTAFDIGYGSSYVYFEIDLGGTKGILDVLIADSTAGDSTAGDFTAEGRMRLTVEETGTDSASLTFGITQHVLVSGTSSGEEVSVDIATAPNAIEINVDGAAQTGSISLGMGAIAVAFSDTTSTATLDLGGLTGLLSITDAGNGLVATNVGVTDGLSYTINDNPALDLTLAPFGFTVNGSDDTITFDTDFDMDFSVNNINGAMEAIFDHEQDPTVETLNGSLTAHADINTMIYLGTDTIVGDYGKLTTGFLSVTGTSYYDGTVSVTDGECLAAAELTVDSSAFPFAKIDCPL